MDGNGVYRAVSETVRAASPSKFHWAWNLESRSLRLNPTKGVQKGMRNGCGNPRLFTKLTQGLLYATVLVIVGPIHGQIPSDPQKPSGTATIRTSSSLVFLDVTVVDRKGHTVSTGL